MSITDMSRSHSRTASQAHGSSSHGAGCSCPTCVGLHTFVRPRFFAGQLLTETELTALSTYVVEKDRLHNRYLHGPGVVCGLQVECDACGPGVVVRPGYAIDPCGADVVLPDGVTVNVVDLIAACQRQDRAADCDPPKAPPTKGCEEQEQSWCLWVRYVEKQGRVVTPLGGGAACTCGRSSGSCGCGGSSAVASARTGTRPSSGCGCSGSAGSSGRDSCSCQQAPRQARRAPADCEPSRISELYEFGVASREGACCDEGLEDRLAGTFPLKVVECITALRPVLSKGMTKSMQTSALSLALGAKSGSGDASRDAICTLYSNVIELFQRDPLHTECVLPQELFSVDCSPYDEGRETPEQYRQRLLGALEALIQLVLLYLRDCLCYSLLPPVPPDVCDDRVMLACVTVRDGRVVRICNLACRRYAGSFVNREYWMPIGPVLSWLAALVCCFPLPTRRFVRMPDERGDPRRVASPGRTILDFMGAGPLDSMLAAVRADSFALPLLWRSRARSAVKRWAPAEWMSRAEESLAADKGTVALAPLLHTDVAKARAVLRRKGVKVEVVEVADRAQALGYDLVPRAAKGETATLYAIAGTVVGVSGSRSVLRDQGARP